MTIKVKMYPHLSQFHSEESGIRRVVENYFLHLPKYDIEMVGIDNDDFDLYAIHAGTSRPVDSKPMVCHCHGLYFTGDYDASNWEWKANRNVVNSIRQADIVTVPSNWVAETLQRDMRFTPSIAQNGINWDEWQHNLKPKNYILGYAKNRKGVDVCNPAYLDKIIPKFTDIDFVGTFGNKEFSNLHITGVLPFEELKVIIQESLLYLSCVKETGNITAMECLAAGVPVVGWRNGATVDVVTHGVDGYMASPGNFDELEYGIKWVLKNRDILSQNARENAKRFDWTNIIPNIARLYHNAIDKANEPPSVNVVIPVHNKPVEQVNRAIKSVDNQDLDFENTITVVLDKCDDKHKLSYDKLLYKNYDKLIEVNYGNVAETRNEGIRHGISKYVLCLDADDWIDKRFIKICVDELEKDKSLGVAYTGLTTHLPNGKEVLSQWPGEFDASRQLHYDKRQNQIPTCAVFRRECWERVGGYRKRYCPNGAGSEDAAFWSAITLAGYEAKQVTKAGLFHYTAFEGGVSGNPDYVEMDWLKWYPSSKDKIYPFACQALPKNGFSHPVFQYDEPLLSIIIPVGDGHEKYLPDLLDSIESQSFRKWEVIIINDNADVIDYEIQTILNSYPYARYISTIGKNSQLNSVKSKGAGYARNRGVEIARAPFLLFIDADDMLNVEYPDALKNMLIKWQKTGNGIYTGHVARSYTSPEYAQQMNDEGKLLGFDESDNETWIKQKPIKFNCKKAQEQPSSNNPNDIYIWNLISTLIPKQWHNEIGGFDESMQTWEDWDYYVRICKAGHCFEQIDDPYLVYRYYSGTRRDLAHKIDSNGRQIAENVLKYITGKHKDIEAMGCSNCGKKQVVKVDYSTARATYSDDEFVLCKYIHPNIGRHNIGKITGVYNGRTVTIPYGYHKGGGTEKFLVHKAHLVNKHLFEAVRVMPEINIFKPKPRTELQEPKPIIKPKKENYDLQLIPGVTPSIEKNLKLNGLTDKNKLVEAGVNGLVKIRGIGEKKAESILDYLLK